MNDTALLSLLSSTTADLPDDKTYVVGAALFRPRPQTPSSSSCPHQLLVVRRAAHEDVFPDNWEIPGGHVDPGETVRDAVVREMREETGLGVVDVVGEFDQLTWRSCRTGRESVQFNFAVAVDGAAAEDGSNGGSAGQVEVELNREEHSEWAWIGVEDLDRLECTEGMRKVLRDAFEFYRSRQRSLPG